MMNLSGLFAVTMALAIVFFGLDCMSAQAQSTTSGRKPNILVIFGDDIGQTNVSAYSLGVVGYKTPNIDRIARKA